MCAVHYNDNHYSRRLGLARIMVQTRFYRLEKDSHCIYAQVIGSWDEKTALQFCVEFKKLADTFNGQPFAHLVYLKDFTVGIPAIEPIIQQLVNQLIEQNLQYVAQVFPPSHYSLTKYQLDKMTISNQGFEKQAFTDETDAMLWLTQSMASITPSWQPKSQLLTK